MVRVLFFFLFFGVGFGDTLGLCIQRVDVFVGVPKDLSIGGELGGMSLEAGRRVWAHKSCPYWMIWNGSSLE